MLVIACDRESNEFLRASRPDSPLNRTRSLEILSMRKISPVHSKIEAPTSPSSYCAEAGIHSSPSSRCLLNRPVKPSDDN